MRVNVAIPESQVTRPVLDASLEAVTRLNQQLLAERKVPLFRDAVNQVRWKPEPPGDEHFDHAGVVLGRGWGDCDDLAPWHAASLRATGEDPGATAFVKKSGPKRWHAVVQRSNGTVDDPSREAGMGQRANGVMGAGLPLMCAGGSEVGTYLIRPQLALRPLIDRDGDVEAWQARADLPWHWKPGKSPTDLAMVSLHASPTSSQAVIGAINGMIDLGEANDAPDDALERASAVAAMCSGADYDEVEDEYGPEHARAASQLVGSFFGSLASAVTSPIRNVANFAMHPSLRNLGNIATSPLQAAMKLAPHALPFIPGIGPLAAQAFHMADPYLQRLISQGGHLPPSASYPTPSASPFSGGFGGFRMPTDFGDNGSPQAGW